MNLIFFREVNTKYGCTSGCESMACGTDCYATKSGENQQCHCVCLDHSNNPCMGGSCFGGDVYNNCAQMFRDNPNQTCGQFKDQCCETCKGVKMDARCPQGDRISSCQNLIASFGKSDFCNMSDSRNKCCQSCLWGNGKFGFCQITRLIDCQSDWIKTSWSVKWISILHLF